jgi:hypothetical protein
VKKSWTVWARHITVQLDIELRDGSSTVMIAIASV